MQGNLDLTADTPPEDVLEEAARAIQRWAEGDRRPPCADDILTQAAGTERFPTSWLSAAGSLAAILPQIDAGVEVQCAREGCTNEPNGTAYCSNECYYKRSYPKPA